MKEPVFWTAQQAADPHQPSALEALSDRGAAIADAHLIVTLVV